MKIYHLFRIWDYKGGELNSSLNNTKLEMAMELIDYLDITDLFDEKAKDLPEASKLEFLKSFVKSQEFTDIIDRRQGNYGGADYCYTIYQSKNGGLMEVDYHKFTKYFPEIYIENL